jgi:hypothetical protein
MFWIPIMMAAAAVMQSQQQNAATKAQNKANKANTYVANAQQNDNSVLSSAKGALNRMNQSIQTRDALKGYGTQWNELENQKVKLGEQMTTGTFKQRLVASENAGALAARSAAAGVGGSTVDMLASTMQIQADMQQADMDQQYSDNLFALNDAEQTNLYNQMGITQQQNVFLDDVAATSVVGPAELPTNSIGSMALSGAMAFMGSASKTGEFSKGGSMDLSSAGTKLKSWFSPGSGTGGSATGASFYQIGGRK